jgi:hypothetical protein
MVLPSPNLDDRRFQDIVFEAKRLIPRYCPEWTNHNLARPLRGPHRAVRVGERDSFVSCSTRCRTGCISVRDGSQLDEVDRDAGAFCGCATYRHPG